MQIVRFIPATRRRDVRIVVALIGFGAAVLAAVLPPLLSSGGPTAGEMRVAVSPQPAVVKPPAPATPNPRVSRQMRVLIVVDTSGSMAFRMSRSDALRRIRAAVQGARTGVKVAPGSFHVGLWESRGAGHYELVPIARLSEPGHRARLVRALDRLLDRQRRDPGTPLYTATKNGVQALEELAGAEDAHNALIMVTDAGNHPPRELVESGMATTAAELDEILGKTSVDVYVTAAWGRCGTLLAEVPSLPRRRCYAVGGRRDISRRLRSILRALKGSADGPA